MEPTSADGFVRAFKEMAARCQEDNPSAIAYVVTTRRQADPATGFRERPDDAGAAPVVVVSGRGKFVGFRFPQGAQPPAGTFLTVNFAQSGGGIVSYSISNRAPNLRAMGDVVAV